MSVPLKESAELAVNAYKTESLHKIVIGKEVEYGDVVGSVFAFESHLRVRFDLGVQKSWTLEKS